MTIYKCKGSYRGADNKEGEKPLTHEQFEQSVHTYGPDILRFCRMTAGSIAEGDDLYQDTMLVLLRQLEKLDVTGNIKSYALSVSLFLWKNKKKKFARRNRLARVESYDETWSSDGAGETVVLEFPDSSEKQPEQRTLRREEEELVRRMVGELPEKYRDIVYLYYSADLKLTEIAQCLHISLNTVKTRFRKAKSILKKRLEDAGYDG